MLRTKFEPSFVLDTTSKKVREGQFSDANLILTSHG